MTDPLFVHHANGDYRLKPNWPARMHNLYLLEPTGE